jgi:hypothetical protein
MDTKKVSDPIDLGRDAIPPRLQVGESSGHRMFRLHGVIDLASKWWWPRIGRGNT